MINLNLDKTMKYLLACSFGPDSMALFHLLNQNGYSFSCAIVNYHLRKESDLEVDGLIKYASRFDIKVHVLDVKEKISKNVEARCREIRYKYFKDLSEEFGFEATLVAHHQDDLIETYLMQKERQNYPIFYGISENTTISDVNIIRPLLGYSKKELLELCNSNSVPFLIDKSNYDKSILRNKIRYEIVNKMNKEDRAKIIKEIELANRQLEALLNSIDKDKLCEVDYVLNLDFKSQCYALNLYAKSLDNSISLSKDNVGQVIDILKSKKPNGQFVIFKGLILIKEYDYFEFELKKIEPISFEYKLERPTILDTPYFFLNFCGDTSDRNVSLSDYPLTIRNIKKSDFIIINGYKANANRLLIDWKVPFRKRFMWPVILNNRNECIYIPRYRKDFKITNKTNFYVK